MLIDNVHCRGGLIRCSDPTGLESRWIERENVGERNRDADVDKVKTTLEKGETLVRLKHSSECNHESNDLDGDLVLVEAANFRRLFQN